VLAPNDLPRPKIIPDASTGIAALVDHLVERGHREVALIEGPRRLKTNAERADAFESAMRRHGIEPDLDLRTSGEFDREQGARALEELLDLGKRFTAVVCLNDQMAVGCLMAARSRGIRVPEDLSIAGIDDLPVAEYLDPPLTTVRVPMRELGREGMRLVLAQLEGSRVRRLRKLECELVVRESTGPPTSIRKGKRVR
jgi:LacI family transcriptional regulator